MVPTHFLEKDSYFLGVRPHPSCADGLHIVWVPKPNSNTIICQNTTIRSVRVDYLNTTNNRAHLSNGILKNHNFNVNIKTRSIFSESSRGRRLRVFRIVTIHATLSPIAVWDVLRSSRRHKRYFLRLGDGILSFIVLIVCVSIIKRFQKTGRFEGPEFFG